MSSFGFNFRQLAGYVTDPTGTAFVTTSNTYPTTVSVDSIDYVVGWNYKGGGAAGSSRNRTSTQDPRLAGMVQKREAPAVFAIELPTSGVYAVRLAFGDAFSKTIRAKIYDDETLIATVADNLEVSGGEFADALGNVYTYATWPTENQPLELNFTSGIFALQICANNVPHGTSIDDAIAHISLEAVTQTPLPPINPSVSNLLATSARLNWEQG